MKVIKNQLLDIWEMAESTEKGLRELSDLEPLDHKLILIVDDDERIRELYNKILTASFPSCTIEMASDGIQAVALFSQKKHGVVLLDYLMPHMNGEDAFFKMVEVCEEKAWQRPSFLFCTGCNPPQSLHNAVASDPAYCLLHKPVRAEILRDAVKARLKG